MPYAIDLFTRERIELVYLICSHCGRGFGWNLEIARGESPPICICKSNEWREPDWVSGDLFVATRSYPIIDTEEGFLYRWFPFLAKHGNEDKRVSIERGQIVLIMFHIEGYDYAIRPLSEPTTYIRATDADITKLAGGEKSSVKIDVYGDRQLS